MIETMISAGMVVKSRAGKDKGGLYVVISMSDYPYVWIADGRKYTLDKPKRKNCRHLVLMETGLAIPNIVSFKISNEWIRSVLNRARDELTREVTHV